MKKAFRYKFYLLITIICVISIIVTSINYVSAINQIHLNSIEKLYSSVKESEKEMLKHTVDNKIKDLELDKETLLKNIEVSYKILDKSLEELYNSSLNEGNAINFEESIKELFYIFPILDVIVWDKTEEQIIYTNDSSIDRSLINSKNELDKYIERYIYFLEKDIYNDDKVFIIGTAKDSYERYTKKIFLQKINNAKLENVYNIWVKEITDYSGTGEYGREITDTLGMGDGEIIYIDRKDDKGEFPLKKELKLINNHGEGFWIYNYEYDWGIDQKIVYSKLYPEYDWVITSLISESNIKELFYNSIYDYEKEIKNKINDILVMYIFVFIAAGILGVLISNHKKMKQDKLDNEKYKTTLQHYRILEKKYDKTMEIIHDIKNHMICIRGISKNLGANQVVDYLNNIDDDIKQLSYIYFTGNKIIDIILNDKMIIMEKYGIKFEHEIRTRDLDFIEDKDLCTIINNLLDNAIDSCNNSKDKNILLKIYCFNHSFIVIKIVNSCDNKPKVTKNRFITSKSEKDLHGYGVKNIKKSINRYNGTMHWVHEESNREFCMVVMVPKENNNIL
ncbi:GHKL domain-containing protein [Romboutsia weinsteinii]|nr:GHKL domain-containing protein [Romboutsia weinsteinii]